MSGAPALTISSCTIPTEGAPSLRFLQGWARCCFPVMAKAKNWATASRAQFLEKRSLESSEEGLCERPEDWSWTSFLHHATGGEGRVEIESEFVCPKFSLPILVILRSARPALRGTLRPRTLSMQSTRPTRNRSRPGVGCSIFSRSLREAGLFPETHRTRNPVRRGLVSAPAQWRWSSYRFYLLEENRWPTQARFWLEWGRPIRYSASEDPNPIPSLDECHRCRTHSRIHRRARRG